MFLSNGKRVGLDDVLASERNLLAPLKSSGATKELQDSLWSSRTAVEDIVAHHLGVRTSQCTVASRSAWMRGQFNVCVPVEAVQPNGTRKKVIFRCPLPHKAGKHNNSSDEKVRSEAANYAYIEANCPEIPVAGLIGFGFSNCHFTRHDHLPLVFRIWHHAQRLLYSMWYGIKLPQYLRRKLSPGLGNPYLLLEFIDARRGRMLSEYWLPKHDHSDPRHENLYRSLSRIMLSLAHHPQPRIGALRFDDQGLMQLVNPPSLCGNAILKNETGLAGLDSTYTSAQSFVFDMLSFRDQVLKVQPNSTNDEDDCRIQMAHSILLRGLASRLIRDDVPAVLQFSDLHASNLFVDEEWHITGVIDLEFMCSLPASMLSVPSWLAGWHVDDIEAKHHATIHRAFMDIFRREEALADQKSLSMVIEESWTSGAYWLYHCLTSINALPFIVEEQLWPLFGFRPEWTDQKTFTAWLSLFWSVDSHDFVAQKVADKSAYQDEVRQYFERRRTPLERAPESVAAGTSPQDKQQALGQTK